MFLNEPDKYEQLVIKSLKNAKNNYNDFIDSSGAIDNVPAGFSLNFESDAPPYLITQIEGKQFKKEKIVKASSGIYYDRDELKQLLATSKPAFCVVTGKVLTDRIEDP